jgi:hypothetical protein
MRREKDCMLPFIENHSTKSLLTFEREELGLF